MAALQCRSSKCTAERKGCRRELDSWRHKLIQCVGIESILDGIYGPMLLRDLNLFDDCEPEEVDDWSPELSCSHCSFCNLPLDKHSDQVPVATSPLSSSSDYSPCQAPTVTESSQLAHRFLQAVFNKKDVSLGCDASIPLVAQELMKKMIHQFAKEYASKHIPHTTTNGVNTRTSSPLSDMSDAPLDLTVSRSQDVDDKEPQSDGVLDLSNRNSSCPAASSSNHKASGVLQSQLTEEVGPPERLRTKSCRNTALDAVLSSLCPAHRSLLFQMLKLAHQEKLQSFSNCRPAGQTETRCSHCGVNSQDVVPPHPGPFSDCNPEKSGPYYPVIDHQGHSTAIYHPGDSRSKCQIHHCPLNNCRREAPHGSNCCCIQRCKIESCPVICPKMLYCISCPTFPAGPINNVMCSFASSSLLSRCAAVQSSSSTLCPSSSLGSNKHNHHSCSSCSNHACLSQDRGTVENGCRERDPSCPVLKRERSPSPPPLSPIPSDINGKADEMPPSLYHRKHGEGADLDVKDGVMNGSHQKVDLDAVMEEDIKCQPPGNSREEQNHSGSLLQDVVNRFSEKLETIKPLEKDPPLTSPATFIAEKEQPQSLSNNHSLPFHGDAHLTEIITTVLHTGNDSDYNLSELFHRHNSKEPKSPNTRARRRKEVRAAMATPVDNASARRHNLQVKREFAVLDQSNSWRRFPPSKRARMKNGNITPPISGTSSDANLIRQAAKKQTEEGLESSGHERFCERPLNTPSSENNSDNVKKELQVVMVQEKAPEITSKGRNGEMATEGKDFLLSGSEMHTPDLQSNPGSNCEDGQEGSCKNQEEAKQRSDGDRVCTGNHNHSCVGERQKVIPHCQPNHSTEARRARRNIVPPQRFSNYVTEPRKMYYAACFSESIFTQRTQKDNDSASSKLDAFSRNSDVNTQDESRIESPLSSPGHKGEFTESMCGDHYETSCSESRDESKVSPQTADTNVKSPKKKKHSSDNRTDGSDSTSKRHGRLRSSLNKLQDAVKMVSEPPTNPTTFAVTISNKSATSTQDPAKSPVQYKSPIKLMLVSPVMDKDGVRYSLKTACSASSTQTEPFDPCEESSWTGTPQVRSVKSAKSASSPRKPACSPSKSASSPRKPACSPSKSASSPRKPACSPSKSASSPRKPACSPSKSASSPRKPACSPSKSASSPRKPACSPSKSASSPRKPACSPSKSASSPRKPACSPSKSASSPRKPACSPSKSASSPRKPACSPSKSASSPRKPACSPSKSASSPGKIACSPSKSTSSPLKPATSPRKPAASPPKTAASPRNASSTSPKLSPRRSGEGSPTKRMAGNESQRFPGDLTTFNETTPPKRRPGRPKKLGPQLEKKIKRPIGRPRKEVASDPVKGTVTGNGNSILASESQENVNKNLKITVTYGRSRRNKRMVCECFDQLQTEFHDACKAADQNGNLPILTRNSQTSLDKISSASTECSQLNLVRPVKECPRSSNNIKCQKQNGDLPLRKPGRPAKVKISGISVTITTVSPRQRKIQLSKDTRQSPKKLNHRKALLPLFRSAKELETINSESTSNCSQTKAEMDAKEESGDTLPNQPVAVRQSVRVRKPSIYLLHAVATSRSYSRSTALLRRSKQLLLNKASHEKKQEAQSSAEERKEKIQLCGQQTKHVSQDLSQAAGVFLDSIFNPKETLRWWAVSAEESTLNQELARRIRLISDTWVSDSQDELAFNSKLDIEGNSIFTGRSKHSSAVRMLFDCPPDRPRSCSMHQLCSWFMQTTETQSLSIVKKASSRNPYELMHFPRSTNKKSVHHSPQAERLRKHMKKFAKTVPKSPIQYKLSQIKLRKRTMALPGTVKRQLFTGRFSQGRLRDGGHWKKSRAFGKYQTTVFRARTRFLTRKERGRLDKRRSNREKAPNSLTGHVTGLQANHKALSQSGSDHLPGSLESSSTASPFRQTQEPVGVAKEQKLCSKAWSPETLKECRVFLRKINSPANESAEEEWDSCTVTLDDGSPSAYLCARRARAVVGLVKTVNSERKSTMNRRSMTLRELAGSGPKAAHDRDEVQRRKRKTAASAEAPRPPPAKTLRQSRGRGLTGPRKLKEAAAILGK